MTESGELQSGYLEGWDYFKCQTDKQPPVVEKQCPICSQTMLVQPGIHVPWRKWSGGPYNYDLFVCPEAHLDYHKQAMCLKLQISMESSQLVSELYEKELVMILQNKKQTFTNKNWNGNITALSLRYMSYRN